MKGLFSLLRLPAVHIRYLLNLCNMVLSRIAVTSLLLFVNTTTASYAFYVGKALTEDGSVMVGGTGEEVSSHWLQIFPAKDHPPNATITVGVTEDRLLTRSATCPWSTRISKDFQRRLPMEA
jgi:hypothetical protein